MQSKHIEMLGPTSKEGLSSRSILSNHKAIYLLRRYLYLDELTKTWIQAYENNKIIMYFTHIQQKVLIKYHLKNQSN